MINPQLIFRLIKTYYTTQNYILTTTRNLMILLFNTNFNNKKVDYTFVKHGFVVHRGWHQIQLKCQTVFFLWNPILIAINGKFNNPSKLIVFLLFENEKYKTVSEVSCLSEEIHYLKINKNFFRKKIPFGFLPFVLNCN